MNEYNSEKMDRRGYYVQFTPELMEEWKFMSDKERKVIDEEIRTYITDNFDELRKMPDDPKDIVDLVQMFTDIENRKKGILTDKL